MTWEVLSSMQDASINHLMPMDDQGAWEARFVQRSAEYWICYLSSHTGCQHSCRFCHLTATGQTMMRPASAHDYLQQAQKVWESYLSSPGQPKWMNYNFMARGEALSNPALVNTPSEVFGPLRKLAEQNGLACNFLVSSIIPREFDLPLAQVLTDPNSIPYYSLYSLDPAFRKRWLPKALPPQRSLELLAEFQRQTGREVVLHWAFIAGANDREQDIETILEALCAHQLKVRFNLVRYNPKDARHGTESDEATLQTRFTQLTQGLEKAGLLLSGSRIVPRVGFDVKASCGMFIERASQA